MNERHDIPERSPADRRKDFFEVTSGFDKQTAMAEAFRCLGCKNAPCMQGCPVSVHIPEMMAAVKKGDFAGAAKIVKATNFLPSV